MKHAPCISALSAKTDAPETGLFTPPARNICLIIATVFKKKKSGITISKNGVTFGAALALCPLPARGRAQHGGRQGPGRRRLLLTRLIFSGPQAPRPGRELTGCAARGGAGLCLYLVQRGAGPRAPTCLRPRSPNYSSGSCGARLALRTRGAGGGRRGRAAPGPRAQTGHSVPEKFTSRCVRGAGHRHGGNEVASSPYLPLAQGEQGWGCFLPFKKRRSEQRRVKKKKLQFDHCDLASGCFQLA